MFKSVYIQELISGNLSNEGYFNIINSIKYYTNKYNWPKKIIVTNEINNSPYWSDEELIELAHNFFDWSLTKEKFDYLDKIPDSYLPYYFSQILISFISNRIKEEQSREGISYDKTRELVNSIIKNEYSKLEYNGNVFVYLKPFLIDDIVNNEELDLRLLNLTNFAINEKTKHYKPIVKDVIENIFYTIQCPISLKKLIETVFKLFIQVKFKSIDFDETITISIEDKSDKYRKINKLLVSELTKVDAELISNFLFNNNDEKSLAVYSQQLNIPKSTLHNKINIFKKKIIDNYIPEDEEDGIRYLQNLSETLDDYLK